MVLWGEARGEPSLGKLAIAWVIKNRALKNGTTLKQEILRPRQFSSFNPNDPNRQQMRLAPGLDPTGWGRCESIADILDYTVDPTHGALNYYNAKVVQPDWGRGSIAWLEKAEIGNHVFGTA